MEIQTRRNSGEIRFFLTLKESLADAKDRNVWKISFGLPNGERVRLVRADLEGPDEFVFSQIEE